MSSLRRVSGRWADITTLELASTCVLAAPEAQFTAIMERAQREAALEHVRTGPAAPRSAANEFAPDPAIILPSFGRDFSAVSFEVSNWRLPLMSRSSS